MTVPEQGIGAHAEPYREQRLAQHITDHSAPDFGLRVDAIVVKEWGSAPLMRLDRGRVYISPEAYVQIRQADDEPLVP